MEARRIAGLSLDKLAEVERLEGELDQFVEKRARQAKDAAVVEEAWVESVRAFREKRRRQKALEWYEYHDCIIRSHEATVGSLVSHHCKERARYAQMLDLPQIGEAVEGWLK